MCGRFADFSNLLEFLQIIWINEPGYQKFVSTILIFSCANILLHLKLFRVWVTIYYKHGFSHCIVLYSMPCRDIIVFLVMFTAFTISDFSTVRQHQANSHAKKGWEQYTDAVIETISKKKRGVVFLLWGNYAQVKSRYFYQ